MPRRKKLFLSGIKYSTWQTESCESENSELPNNDTKLPDIDTSQLHDDDTSKIPDDAIPELPDHATSCHCIQM